MPDKGIESYRRQMREDIWRRDGGRCVYCSKPLTRASMTIDHQIAIGSGGTDELHNMVLCCRPCNTMKGDKSVEEFRERLKWKLNKMPFFSPDQVHFLRTAFDIDIAPRDKRFWFERRADGDQPPFEPGARYSYEGRRKRTKKGPRP